MFEGLGAVPTSFALSSGLARGITTPQVRRSKLNRRAQEKGPRPGTRLAGRNVKGRFKQQAVRPAPIDFRIQNPAGQFLLRVEFMALGQAIHLKSELFMGA